MTKTTNERELALAVLLSVLKEGAPAHLALRNILEKYQYIDKKERAFVTRVVEGTLEHLIEIDYIIDQFSKVKSAKMKPVICMILRISVYQMKYMDHVPDSAVCNEAVKLAKKKGFQSLAGFVNGVLRNIGRNLSSITYPKEPKSLCWSVQYSMPEWIIDKWLLAYSEDTVETILQDIQREKPTCIRFDPDKISKEDLTNRLLAEGVEKAEEHPLLPYALLISGYDYLGFLESFEEGLFYVQDASSMMAVESLPVKSGDYIIDVCAAPGGKALHAAEKLAGTGHVEARDLTEYKVGLLKENIERCGMRNVEAVRMDALVYDEASCEKADIVIADLPCSGLGVLSGKKDIRYRMTEKQTTELSQLQRKMLSVVKDYVKPGGCLLYSTCTINREENEENTAWFLGEYPEFVLEKEKQYLPGIDPCDGFYLAVLKKQES
ncbi:16S rRNA (cytosine(967)-C(5))-methyltransferase RsmB [Sellimonas sp.]|uniref:16S rRNA (cytosine(967)-C(5))-methyltransferase RsmB n=1 Tax=Sellimonas sp. TaxID=2021466 RepID=UPI000B3A84E6|nr:16S rRNA (cytosine(967)-C(5))-methyltransferase RsmB [Sellimonas sp.]OUP01152.1 16S rRNA (cytosine(967)-C(5))-methyltransferase [Drancourtella sp. An210]